MELSVSLVKLTAEPALDEANIVVLANVPAPTVPRPTSQSVLLVIV